MKTWTHHTAEPRLLINLEIIVNELSFTPLGFHVRTHNSPIMTRRGQVANIRGTIKYTLSVVQMSHESVSQICPLITINEIRKYPAFLQERIQLNTLLFPLLILSSRSPNSGSMTTAFLWRFEHSTRWVWKRRTSQSHVNLSKFSTAVWKYAVPQRMAIRSLDHIYLAQWV